MQNPELPIHDMSQRHSGLTQSLANSYTEAARVCLDRHHKPPTAFEIRESERRMDATVQWKTTGAHTSGAWNNETDTTEAGAYACVLAAVELFDCLAAVRRAESGTGADYYLAPLNATADDMEDWIRIEISGTDLGNAATIARRLKEKLNQAAGGDSSLPAMAGVIGFCARLIRLARVEET